MDDSATAFESQSLSLIAKAHAAHVILISPSQQRMDTK